VTWVPIGPLCGVKLLMVGPADARVGAATPRSV
jgi:hypothetical protein